MASNRLQKRCQVSSIVFRWLCYFRRPGSVHFLVLAGDYRLTSSPQTKTITYDKSVVIESHRIGGYAHSRFNVIVLLIIPRRYMLSAISSLKAFIERPDTFF